jgi:Txe/YoeB family toxin of toxin-antitoxin system
VSFRVVFTKKAMKHLEIVKQSPYSRKVRELVAILQDNPYQTPPPFEKLAGDLTGKFSRRINEQHRLVYEVYEAECTVKIISIWSHYE